MKENPPKSTASAAEVAKLAGVSRSAVSRTFTDGASVSALTRKKVLEAADVLNYHVNHLARGLSNKKSRPVCIIGADLKAPYQASLLDAITQRLQLAGRAVMLINTAGSEASSNDALHQTINYRASATIVLSGTPQVSLIETCINSGQHVILVNRAGQFQGADHITINYKLAMDDAHHMLSRAGCNQLAVVSSTIKSPSLLAREKMFMQAADEAGHQCSLIRCGPTSYETGAAAARSLLAARKRPQGVFCVTDLIACGFLDVARKEFALKVPEDICIIGFDDIEQSNWIGYQLTTFSQPQANIADAITELLKDSLSRERKEKHLIFNAPLVWRSTVRPS